MKRILSIAVFSLAAASCINKVPIDFGEVTPQLVLNAQLDAQEGGQVVYLSQSNQATLKPLQGAQVAVLVDGKPFATAVEEPSDETDAFRVGTAYRFQGGFPAGSQVKVTARKDAWDAWAQADVPPAPVISAVDTLRTLEQDLDESYEVFQVRITFKDLPGSSYYRVGVRAEYRTTQIDAQGETRELPVDYQALPMSGSKDPVLGGTAAGMSFFDLDKTYLAFSDDLFRDQEYTLRLSMPASWLSYYYFPLDQEFVPVYIYYTVTLVPWLESISREEFDYLNALNNLENFGYTAQVIVEPTTLPTNVNGGMGLFTVRNRAEGAPMELPPVFYEVDYGPYWPYDNQD